MRLKVTKQVSRRLKYTMQARSVGGQNASKVSRSSKKSNEAQSDIKVQLMGAGKLCNMSKEGYTTFKCQQEASMHA